jgi:hypothetical protein
MIIPLLDISLPWWVVYSGWLVPALLSGSLRNTTRPALKAIRRGFTFVAWLWFLGVIVYGGYRLFWTEHGVDTGYPFRLAMGYLRDIYGFIGGYLGRWTDEVIYLTPIMVMSGFGLLNIKLKQPLEGILTVWFVAVFFYFLYWCILQVYSNPPSLIIFAVFIYILNLFNDVMKAGRYSTTTIIRGLQFRAASLSDTTQRTMAIRQLAMLAGLVAFWYQYEISKDSLAELYAALFSGLLTIIGFAALIFTFAFEHIPTPRMRRAMAEDIKAIFRDVGLVCVFAVIGLLFLSNSAVRFSLGSVDITGAFAVSVLCCSALGTLLAVESTVKLFQQLIDVVSGVRFGAKITVAFDEIRTSQSDSAVSDAGTGLSQLRAHVEDKGYSAVSIEQANISGLGRLRNAILVIQRVSHAVSPDDAMVYRRFAERGEVLFVLMDAVDFEHKKSLLTCCNIVAQPFPFGEGEARSVSVSQIFLPGFSPLGALRMNLENPVFFSEYERHVSEVANSDRPTPTGAHAPVIIVAPVGAGLIFFVGGVRQWTNDQLGNESNVDFLDSLLDYADKHLAQVRQTVSLRQVQMADAA